MNKVVVLKLVHMETLALALLMLLVFVVVNCLVSLKKTKRSTDVFILSCFWLPMLMILWWIVRQFC